MSDERPQVQIFNFTKTMPRLWTRDDIGSTDAKWWFYDVGEVSKWFRAWCIGCLEPGESQAFHTHAEDIEGPYECWYIVMHGLGELRTEFGDHLLQPNDSAFMPPGAAHQMRNAGDTRLWWATISSRGGHELAVDTYDLMPHERPGYREEYERIMASRREQGLPVP